MEKKCQTIPSVLITGVFDGQTQRGLRGKAIHHSIIDLGGWDEGRETHKGGGAPTHPEGSGILVKV